MFTKRELQILHLIAYEQTVPEIAQSLYVSPDTIKTHKKSLFRKLEAKNAAGLIRRAFERGMLKTG